jgi:asparagine synthase (glutamine-hydrolysing)
MFRYIALVRDLSDTGQSDAADLICRKLGVIAPEYRVLFDCRELRILCAEEGTPGLKAHSLSNHAGALLGSVFVRHSDLNDDSIATPATFDSENTDELISSRGRALITGYWGDYVAFLFDSASRTIRIIKDPTGELPCFITSWRRIVIAFSCLCDLVDLTLLTFTANWSYVASRLGSGGYDLRLSPLNEVSPVHRGQCLEIALNENARQTRRLYWNPTAFSDPPFAIDNAATAARAMRAAVRSATHTLAAGHDSVLMRLSGGLDSSVISGCLKESHAGLKVTSYTYFVERGRSDERRWARLAAAYAGSEHLELATDPSSTNLEVLSQVRPTATPVWAYAYAVRDEMERKILQSHPYTGIFCGDGGDSGFGGDCISSALDDFLRLRGFSRGVVQLAARVALRTNSLTWTILGESIHRRLFGSSMSDHRDELLLGAALVSRTIRGVGLHSPQYPHPWLDMCQHVPWHVIKRLGNLMGTPELYNPFLAPTAFSPYVFAPLYSQPVVELSLRIPVYILFHRGCERGLAREAFRHDVPYPILRRQWKDRAPGAFEDLVRRNRAFLYDTLLGGVLCREGLLDRTAIESALSGALSMRQFQVIELMNCLHLENWLRHFVGNSVRRLAA